MIRRVLAYYKPYWYLLASDLIAVALVATLIIAHRLSTIRNADEIIVLTEAGIAQRGTHGELIGEPGLYAELYNAQTGLITDGIEGEGEAATNL